MDYEVDLNAAEFLEILKAAGDDVVLIDIRTADEFEVYHLSGAINIDFYAEDFADMLDELERDAACMIYCRTGRRTGTAENNARDLMLDMGFARVHNMLGGIHEFVKLPDADDFIE
jgi:rhodanese-related sulfurtransferase